MMDVEIPITLLNKSYCSTHRYTFHDGMGVQESQDYLYVNGNPEWRNDHFPWTNQFLEDRSVQFAMLKKGGGEFIDHVFISDLIGDLKLRLISEDTFVIEGKYRAEDKYGSIETEYRKLHKYKHPNMDISKYRAFLSKERILFITGSPKKESKTKE